MVDGMTTMLSKANEAGHIQRFVQHVIPGEVTQLQYTDDTMVLIKPSDLGITNIKFILLCFKNMSGLKINFDKIKVVVMGVKPHEQCRVANMLNCKLVKFPIKHLGLPVNDRCLRVVDWNFLYQIKWVIGLTDVRVYSSHLMVVLN
jgi:hypothetical protein